MKVKFVLTMDDVMIGDERIDQVIFDWESELEQDEILEVSHRWITSKNFLTQRMEGLTRVGESTLTIEPLEDMESEEDNIFNSDSSDNYDNFDGYNNEEGYDV